MGQDLACAASPRSAARGAGPGRLDAETIWPTAEQMTLQAVADKWGGCYHVHRDGPPYAATPADEDLLITAATPERLESAIRAHRWRRVRPDREGERP